MPEAHSDRLPLHEMPVSPEAVQPVINEVERLMTGVFSVADGVPGMDGPLINTSTREARFPVHRGKEEVVYLDQIGVEGELTTRVSVSSRNNELTTSNKVVNDVTKLWVSSDGKGIIKGYDYFEQTEEYPAEGERPNGAREVVLTDTGVTEVQSTPEAEAQAILKRQQEAEPPTLTGKKLDDILAILAAASVENREVVTGSEELTLNI